MWTRGGPKIYQLDDVTPVLPCPNYLTAFVLWYTSPHPSELKFVSLSSIQHFNFQISRASWTLVGALPVSSVFLLISLLYSFSSPPLLFVWYYSLRVKLDPGGILGFLLNILLWLLVIHILVNPVSAPSNFLSDPFSNFNHIMLFLLSSCFPSRCSFRGSVHLNQFPVLEPWFLLHSSTSSRTNLRIWRPRVIEDAGCVVICK